MNLKITVDSVPYEVSVEVAPPVLALPSITIGAGPALAAPAATAKAAPAGAPASAQAAAAPASGHVVTAPLVGVVNRVYIEAGEQVAEGQVLVILEAMKMETEILSPAAGVVESIAVNPGDPVHGGQALVVIK